MAGRIMVAPSFLGIGDHGNYNKLYVPLSRFFQRINSFNPDRIHLDFSGADRFIIGNHDPRILWLIMNFTRELVEFHLMTDWPLKYLGLLSDGFPADNRGKHVVIVHPEAADYDPLIFHLIGCCGFSPGLALKPATGISTISKNLLEILDLILVMTVEPGQSGQAMLLENLSKVSELAKLRQQNNYHYLLEVDGGVNEATAQLAVNAGADILVSGGFVRDNPRKIKWLQNLKRES